MLSAPRARLALLLESLIVLCVLWPFAASAMNFERGTHCEGERCQPALYARGAIDKDTPAQFQEAATAATDTSLVVLTSKGGSLGGGLKLGQAIRERRYNTQIEAECFSACAYAFLGGVERVVPAGAKLGLHQFRGDDQTLDAARTQKISALLSRYLDAMGVDRRFLDVAQLTATDRVSVLSAQQMATWRVDTRSASAPRWRLEATSSGVLVAMVGAAVPLGRHAVTVAITRLKSNWRLVVLVRNASAGEEYSIGMPVEIVIDGQSTPANNATQWLPAKDGRQIWFDLPEAAVQRLFALGEQANFELAANWPMYAAGKPVKVLKLGANGLRNALSALQKSEGGNSIPDLPTAPAGSGTQHR